MCYLSLITWNMLLFCWRMCLQLVLLGSNCFISNSFCKQGYPFSPCCYCALLVNCTNHFFLRVFCAVPPKCHTGNVFTFLWDCGKGDWFCYPPHPTPCLIFYNKKLVLKRDRRGDRLLFMCVMFHHLVPLLL